MKEFKKAVYWLLLLAAVCLVILGLILLFTPVKKLAGLTAYVAWALFLAGLAEVLLFFDRQTGPWFLTSGLVKALVPVFALTGGLQASHLALLVLLAASLQLLAAHKQKGLVCCRLAWPAALAVLFASPQVLRLLTGQAAVFCSGLMLIACGLAELLLFFSLQAARQKTGGY